MPNELPNNVALAGIQINLGHARTSQIGMAVTGSAFAARDDRVTSARRLPKLTLAALVRVAIARKTPILSL